MIRSEHDCQQLVETAKQAIERFLSEARISLETCKNDTNLALISRGVHEKIGRMDFGNIPPHRYEHHIGPCINLATMAYGHTPPEVQVDIAVFSVVTMCVDDLDVDSRAMEEFDLRLCMRSRQLHPVLDNLVMGLQSLSQHYLPYVSSAMFASVSHLVIDSL